MYVYCVVFEQTGLQFISDVDSVGANHHFLCLHGIRLDCGFRYSANGHVGRGLSKNRLKGVLINQTRSKVSLFVNPFSHGKIRTAALSNDRKKQKWMLYYLQFRENATQIGQSRPLHRHVNCS